MQPHILILYYSRSGGTANLARYLARGVQSQGTFEARIRTVPPVSAATEQTVPAIPESGAIYCSKDDRPAAAAWPLARRPASATWPRP